MGIATGTKLGCYEILSPIGAGGMGEVYRANDAKLDRHVAVKVLSDRLARDPDALARFEREAKAVAALSHPNILAIHDFGTDEGVTFIVTELLEGETLRGRIQRSPVPWRKAVALGVGIADGLAAAHEKGIIHRDLKPENIFLTADGVVKILDFGLAKTERTEAPVDHTITLDTKPGTLMGTGSYMSPEQVRGRALDARTDIFSFGCVLYEMVTGDRAFSADTSAETMTAVLNFHPPEPAETGATTRPELDQIIGRCLEKKPEQRFHSSNDLAFTLRNILSGSGQSQVVARTRLISPRAVVTGLTVAVVLLIAGIVYFPRQRERPIVDGLSIRSLAVLPLEDRSGNEDQAFFADAMTEELITALAKISALRVTSPTSIWKYKGTREPFASISKALNGIDAFVTGLVVRDGDRVRITAHLVEATTERLLWSNSYNGTMRDILALQAEVAQAIAEEIRVEVTPEERSVLASAPSVDPGAYDLYVRGREILRRGTADAFQTALTFFDEALVLDPDFALAHAGRANAYYLLASRHVRPARALAQMKEAVDAALALDENLGVAHASLGYYQMQQEWDWERAGESFERAVELDRNSSYVRLGYAMYLVAMNRPDEAMSQIDMILERDPDARHTEVDFGAVSYMAHRWDRAIRDGREALKVDPAYWSAHEWMGLAHSARGEFPDAIRHLRAAWQASKSNGARAMLGGVLAVAGEVVEARSIRAELKALDAPSYICPYEVATISIGLKEYDEAFEEINEACDDRAACIPWLQRDPRLDPIRNDARFDELLVRVGFEPAGQTLTVLDPPGGRIMLAVLPFTDNSPEPKEWLAAGLAAQISARLGRLRSANLGVIGPETTAYYASSGKPLREIGRLIGADYILRGTLQSIDPDVSITAALIRISDLTQAWSDVFKGTLDDPFAMQSMVAEKIIAGLPFELTGEERVRLKNRYAADPNAELAYMQGRFIGSWEAGGEKNLLRAVSYFEQAIKLDPTYALPYCGLVDAKCFLATWGTLQTSQIRSEMEDTVARALALDDTLAETHVSAGLVATFLNWDWPTAEAAFERAIQLNPNIASAYQEYGFLLVLVGRYDEAKERFEQAIRLDPVSSAHLCGLGMLHAGLGRLSEAEPLLQKALELNKDSLDASFWLADVRQKQGRFDDAVKIMERSVFSMDHPELARLCFLGNAYAMAGRRDDARKQLAEMQKLKGDLPGHHMWFAEMHAALGEKDEAFRRLDQALAAREAWLPHIRFDPGLIHIRNDPRFAELHRKMGLGHVDLSAPKAAP